MSYAAPSTYQPLLVPPPTMDADTIIKFHKDLDHVRPFDITSAFPKQVLVLSPPFPPPPRACRRRSSLTRF